MKLCGDGPDGSHCMHTVQLEALANVCCWCNVREETFAEPAGPSRGHGEFAPAWPLPRFDRTKVTEPYRDVFAGHR